MQILLDRRAHRITELELIIKGKTFVTGNAAEPEGWHSSHNVQPSKITANANYCTECGWTDARGNETRRSKPCTASTKLSSHMAGPVRADSSTVRNDVDSVDGCEAVSPAARLDPEISPVQSEEK